MVKDVIHPVVYNPGLYRGRVPFYHQTTGACVMNSTRV